MVILNVLYRTVDTLGVGLSQVDGPGLYYWAKEETDNLQPLQAYYGISSISGRLVKNAFHLMCYVCRVAVAPYTVHLTDQLIVKPARVGYVKAVV